jgi:galactose mutarotase-like enzyme
MNRKSLRGVSHVDFAGRFGVMAAENLILSSGPARASIALRGGEWRSWSVDDVDLLWPGDPAVWPGVAPVLFPVVGWTRDGRVRVCGATYELGVHGFAGDADFILAQHTDDRALLVLEDAAESRARYPFTFRLEIAYRLTATAMHVTLSVANTGSGVMPYAVGLHPGFRWPLAGSAAPHAIVFESPERPDVPVIAPGGLFSRRRRPVPLAGRMLRLTPDLLAAEALCFLDISSRRLLYENGAGQWLRITLDNFPHVALWARSPAPFLAIEAWTGHGDPEDFDGELFEKPSMILLEPGARAGHAARYEFLTDLQDRPLLPKGR